MVACSIAMVDNCIKVLICHLLIVSGSLIYLTKMDWEQSYLHYLDSQQHISVLAIA
jgi:hypothetical protein